MKGLARINLKVCKVEILEKTNIGWMVAQGKNQGRKINVPYYSVFDNEENLKNGIPKFRNNKDVEDYKNTKEYMYKQEQILNNIKNH